MTEHELSKFWSDVALAYTQVALNHEREITVTAEDLTATVEYDSLNDSVVIVIVLGTDTPYDERDL